MPQADRGGDSAQFETPRAEERAPVIPPALVPSGPPVAESVSEVLGDLHAMRWIGARPITPQLQPPLGPRQPVVHLSRLGLERRPSRAAVFEEDPDLIP